MSSSTSTRGWFHDGTHRIILAGMCAACVALSLDACSPVATGTSSEQEASSATNATSDATSVLDTSDMFTNRDSDPSYDESKATAVTLDGATATVEGDGATTDGATVTIAEAGTYLVSGTLTDGQIVVDAGDDKVQIVLDGASVTNDDSPAVWVKSADKVFLTLAEGSSNTLATSGAFATSGTDTLPDATLFAQDDLTINGTGSLSVASTAKGVDAKDDLKLCGGTVSIDATDHAIDANDSVRVSGGSYTLSGGTDGVHVSNDDDAEKGYFYMAGGTLTIEAGSDGVDASYVAQVDGGEIHVTSAADDGISAESDLLINGGTVAVDSSHEGLEGARVTINGGSVDVTAADDGINATGEPGEGSSEAAEDGGGAAQAGGPGRGGQAPSGGAARDGAMGSDSTAKITISGGTTTIDTEGDGLDSNGDLEITGGETYVSGPTTDGNSPIDYGEGATASISGGTLVAAGSTGMVETFSDSSTQGVMLVSVSGSAGDGIQLLDDGGNVLASYVAAKDFAGVTLSAPGVEVGGTYTVRIGDTETQVTMSSIVYSDVRGGRS